MSILAAIGSGMAVGLLNGVLIAKGGITDFIVTLGMLSAATGFALIISDGKPTQVIDAFLLDLTVNGFGVITWAVILAVVIAVARTSSSSVRRSVCTCSQSVDPFEPPGQRA